MPQAAKAPAAARSWDPESFRLRTLVKRLMDMGEVRVHEQPVALSALAPIIENSTEAHLFRQAGPEKHELVSSVTGTRKRLAAAFDVFDDDDRKRDHRMREELSKRHGNPQKAFEVPSNEAPVHEVVETGAQIDLTRLPFYVHHEYDGAPYISSGIDFTRDPLTGRNNVGARRLMLRGRDKAGINLTAPSDLRNIYLGCVARGEKLPCSFVVGSHPLYIMAAGSRGSGDELDTMATFRGAPLATVKCLTNDLRVPADAEMVLEGYLDERGYIDHEGPYGEYMGFYGPMHGDPVFHVTAITRRKDILHHTYKHGYGLHLGECDGGPMGMLQTETRAWNLLRGAGLEPTDVFAIGAAGVSHHLRVAIRKRGNGDPRAAIAVLFGNIMTLKHVWVTDEDVNIRSSEQMEWAMSTRFQADKDLVVLTGMREMPMDPSTDGKGIGAKAGFDCTFAHPRSQAVTLRVPVSANIGGPARFKTVKEALASGPLHFAGLMSVLGSDDGRELVLEIEKLRDSGLVDRKPDGEYYLK